MTAVTVRERDDTALSLKSTYSQEEVDGTRARLAVLDIVLRRANALRNLKKPVYFHQTAGRAESLYLYCLFQRDEQVVSFRQNEVPDVLCRPRRGQS